MVDSLLWDFRWWSFFLQFCFFFCGWRFCNRSPHCPKFVFWGILWLSSSIKISGKMKLCFWQICVFIAVFSCNLLLLPAGNHTGVDSRLFTDFKLYFLFLATRRTIHFSWQMASIQESLVSPWESPSQFVFTSLTIHMVTNLSWVPRTQGFSFLFNRLHFPDFGLQFLLQGSGMFICIENNGS